MLSETVAGSGCKRRHQVLTAIWNVLSKLEPYSAKGYLTDKLTEHSVVISKSQGLELLRKRGYIFKDEVATESG